MRYINRRLKQIEQKLSLTDEPEEPKVFIIGFTGHKEAEQALPEDVKEWLTYKEQVKDGQTHRIILLLTVDEIRARQGLPPIMQPEI